MDQKDLELTCPCCESRLTVDLRTGHVVRTRRPEERDPTGRPVVRASDWDSMANRVQGRLGQASSKFDEGLARERSKPRDLDALFAEAKRKLEDDDEEDSDEEDSDEEDSERGRSDDEEE